ncbi:hypothetical protein RDI58_019970 [Solanum bulbocastanum]|uniref:DUF4216 domain-containing protein n=1 Tax=Solanum bulbocastanum TaxID=147425 RepID=A0AAN8T6A5_SOLBU
MFGLSGSKHCLEGETGHGEGEREGLSEDAKRFFKLVYEGKKELYPGCENFSKLSFIIRLYLLKSLHGLSDVAFTNLLDLLKEAFPFAQLPKSFNKAKKIIKDLGLGYDKIHACPNDCMLFWNENAEKYNCSVCGSSRWSNEGDCTINGSSKIPAKILRHPVDGEAWKDFDSMHPNFSKDPQFLIFGLRYLHYGVKTPFSRYRTEDDEDVEKEGDDLSLLFPKLRHLVGNGKKKKGKTFTMDLELSSEVHRYVLFNTGDEQVEDFIKEHKMLIDRNIRSNAWTTAMSHSQEFGNWFKEKVKNVEVPNQCDWFHNEIDEYGLTRVYFTKSRSTDDPFVLASQVHQVFYVADPIKKDVYYARNKVPVDLLSDVDMRWSREDIPIDVVDMPSDAQFSEDTTIGTLEDEDDFDETDWDWMDADD